MILVDREIRFLLARKELVLDPVDPAQVQPASIDLRLHRRVQLLKEDEGELDLSDPELATQYEESEIPDEGLVVPPHGSIFVQVKEYMRIPDTCMGRIAQRSSLMRAGIHVSSSLINPGYAGHLPCLLQNATARGIRIFADVPFCQLILHRCIGRPERTYAEKGDAKYHEERPSRPSAISADIRRWVKPAPRPLNPEEAARLKVELLPEEDENG